MRKITADIIRAFSKGTSWKRDNTMTDGKAIFLHGNKIAEKRPDGLWITSAGWRSVTTKERLNGLDGVSINQKKGAWFLNGKEWSGEWIKV